MKSDLRALLLCVCSIGCLQEGVPDTDTIRAFDDMYITQIRALCERMEQSLGTDSNYYAEYLPRYQKVSFNYLEVGGKRGEFFYPEFHLSKDEINLFNQITDIIYSRSTRTFRMKLYRLRSKDKAVWLTIHSGDQHLIHQDKAIIYDAPGRFYKWGNGW